MSIFHSKANPKEDLQSRYQLCTEYIEKLNSARELKQVFNLHKELWGKGIQCRQIGPDECGMFRTSDISNMSEREVYLGNVYGIWTNPIPVFEDEKFKYDSDGRLTEDYMIIVNQYKEHLVSNVRSLRNEIFDTGVSRDLLAKNLESLCKDMYMYGRSISIQNILIDEKFVSKEKNQFITVSFDRFLDEYPRPDVSRRTSTVLMLNGHILVPDDFEKGVIVDRKNFLTKHYADLNQSRPGHVSYLSLKKNNVTKTPEKSQTGDLTNHDYRQKANEFKKKTELKGIKIGF